MKAQVDPWSAVVGETADLHDLEAREHDPLERNLARQLIQAMDAGDDDAMRDCLDCHEFLESYRAEAARLVGLQ